MLAEIVNFYFHLFVKIQVINLIYFIVLNTN